MAHLRKAPSSSLFPSTFTLLLKPRIPSPISLPQTTTYSTLRRRHNLRGPRQLITNITPSSVKNRIIKNSDAAEPFHSPSADTTGTVTAVVSAPEHEGGVLKKDDSAARVLEHGAVAVTRQIETLNVFLGFEQANKYTIADALGNPLGFIAEEEAGFGSVIMRQLFRNHRPFKATVMNSEGEVILRIERPFALINSRATVSHSTGRIIGEVFQRWHLWRRKYDLVASSKDGSPKQFALVDAPFLSWEFRMVNAEGGLLGTIDRNFTGFAREFFTDTGHYVLRMDSVEGGTSRQLTLDERAVTLACAITTDIDYFSRHHGGLPIPFFGGGGGGGGGVPATTTGTGMPLPIPMPIPMPMGGAGGVGTAVEAGTGAVVGAGAGALGAEIGVAGIHGLGQNDAHDTNSPTGSSDDDWGSSSTPYTNEWGDEITPDDGFVDDGFDDDDGGGFFGGIGEFFGGDE